MLVGSSQQLSLKLTLFINRNPSKVLMFQRNQTGARAHRLVFSSPVKLCRI